MVFTLLKRVVRSVTHLYIIKYHDSSQDFCPGASICHISNIFRNSRICNHGELLRVCSVLISLTADSKSFLPNPTLLLTNSNPGDSETQSIGAHCCVLHLLTPNHRNTQQNHRNTHQNHRNIQQSHDTFYLAHANIYIYSEYASWSRSRSYRRPWV